MRRWEVEGGQIKRVCVYILTGNKEGERDREIWRERDIEIERR